MLFACSNFGMAPASNPAASDLAWCLCWIVRAARLAGGERPCSDPRARARDTSMRNSYKSLPLHQRSASLSLQRHKDRIHEISLALSTSLLLITLPPQPNDYGSGE